MKWELQTKAKPKREMAENGLHAAQFTDDGVFTNLGKED